MLAYSWRFRLPFLLFFPPFFFLFPLFFVLPPFLL
jgi:hypothetical protein